MAENPLIGKKISLISKKNIRYSGTLYSINEQNATVALQNVRSFGTEGREPDPAKFVGPTDAVHPFLLFRGQDIKDLHVHEEAAAAEPPPAAAAAESSQQTEQPAEGPAASSVPPPPPAETDASSPPAETPAPVQDPPTRQADDVVEDRAEFQVEDKSGPYVAPSLRRNPDEGVLAQSTRSPEPAPKTMAAVVAAGTTTSQQSNNNYNTAPRNAGRHQQQQGGYNGGRRGRGGGRGNNRKVSAAPGTGASLLNRTARGSNNDKTPEDFQQDFDFQSNLQEFQKENYNDAHPADDGGDTPVAEETPATAYDKDDFFDSISSDATDRASGIDNRLRGRQERTLNTETFGAVALNHSDRRRGGRGGRGRGRGRGRGGGGGGDGSNTWRYHNNSGGSGGGGRGGGRGRGRGRGRGGGGYRNSTGRPEADNAAAAAAGRP